MHYQQLANARGMLFPGEDPSPKQNLAALTPENSNYVEMDEVDEEDDLFLPPSDTRGRSTQSFRIPSFRIPSRPSLDRRTSSVMLGGPAGMCVWSPRRDAPGPQRESIVALGPQIALLLCYCIYCRTTSNIAPVYVFCCNIYGVPIKTSFVQLPLEQLFDSHNNSIFRTKATCRATFQFAQ